jgi:hypothetical protein
MTATDGAATIGLRRSQWDTSSQVVLGLLAVDQDLTPVSTVPPVSRNVIRAITLRTFSFQDCIRIQLYLAEVRPTEYPTLLSRLGPGVWSRLAIAISLFTAAASRVLILGSPLSRWPHPVRYHRHISVPHLLY